MRSIKFRGYAIPEMVNSQWIYGFGVDCAEYADHYAKELGRKRDWYLYTESSVLPVHEKSIGQYTGLKDKNGKEIYEGDIVYFGGEHVVKFGEFGVPNIEDEEYQDHAVGFYFQPAHDLKNIAPFNMTIPLNEIYSKQAEVIGNIHENPELLEGEAE